MPVRAHVTLLWESTIVESYSFVPPRRLAVQPAERTGYPRLPLILLRGEIHLVVSPSLQGTVQRPGEPVRRVTDFNQPPPPGKESPSIHLPLGSTAEVVLSTKAPASCYRAPTDDSRLFARLTIEPDAGHSLRRALVNPRNVLAGMVLSVVLHGAVFATEPDSVLLSGQDQDQDQDQADVAVTLSSCGGWDREIPSDPRPAIILGPLNSGSVSLRPDGECGLDARCQFSEVDGPSTRSEGYPEIPSELRACFSGSKLDLGTRKRPVVTFADPDPEPVEPGDRRRVRHIGGQEFRGYMVVSKMTEPEPGTSPFELRVLRESRPLLAFGEDGAHHLLNNLNRTLPAFQWCYERALVDVPGLSGKLTLRLSADGGAVEEPRLAMADAALACCIEQAQRLWGLRMYGDGEARVGLSMSPGQ